MQTVHLFASEGAGLDLSPAETPDDPEALVNAIGQLMRHVGKPLCIAESDQAAVVIRPLEEPGAARQLGAFFCDLSEHEATLMKEALPFLLQLVKRQRAQQLQAALKKQVELLSTLYPPTIAPGATGEIERLHDALSLRQEFMREEPTLTSDEVAKLAGSTSTNRSAIASKWRKLDRVFSVRFADRDNYPAWQFTKEGQPHPFMAVLLPILRTDPTITDWDIALWFTNPTDWLSGDAPKELLTQFDAATLERLTFAAEQEAAAE